MRDLFNNKVNVIEISKIHSSLSCFHNKSKRISRWHTIYLTLFICNISYIKSERLFFAIYPNWNVWTRETGECRQNEYQTSFFFLKSMRVSLNLLFVAKRIYLTFIRFNHLEFDSDWVARIFTIHSRFNTHIQADRDTVP